MAGFFNKRNAYFAAFLRRRRFGAAAAFLRRRFGAAFFAAFFLLLATIPPGECLLFRKSQKNVKDNRSRRSAYCHYVARILTRRVATIF